MPSEHIQWRIGEKVLERNDRNDRNNRNNRNHVPLDVFRWHAEPGTLEGRSEDEAWPINC